MKKKDIYIGLLIAAILAIFSFFSSSSPDGLKKVAQDKNFIARATNIIKAPIPGYLFPGLSNKSLSDCLAGLFGVVTVFVVSMGLGNLLLKKDK